MISVAGLIVTFGHGQRAVRAVDGVSFHVAQGESYGLVGESGSGKTTIIRTLMGLNETWTGDIRVNEHAITPGRRSKAFCRLVQMVFQDPYGSLHPRHTVNRVLSEPLAIHGMPAPEQKIIESLRAVGLEAALRFRYPHQLSGGQRQRVAIARALILEPAVLLLDEPTSALDVSVQAEILALFTDIRRQRGLTTVLVTHNLAVVAQLCERIGVMQNGKIEEELTVGELQSGAARHPYTQKLMLASNGFHRMPPASEFADQP